MTSNQLSYLNLRETHRNNLRLNRENKRHNKVTERQNKRAIKETLRHNLVTEGLQVKGYANELAKANISAEATKYAAQTSAEASKHNANIAAQAQRDAATIGAQAQLRVAQTNKQIQAAHDKMNKIINDAKLDNDTKIKLLDNSSKQFIAELDRQLQQYKIDTERDTKLRELENELVKAAASKNNSTKTIVIGKILAEISAYVRKKIESTSNKSNKKRK